MHLQPIRISVERLVIVDLRSVELQHDLLALCGCQRDRAEFEHPLGDGTGFVHSEKDASSLVLGVEVVESDLIHYGGLIYGAALELRVSDVLSGAIINSENVCATTLLVLIAESRPVPQISEHVELLVVVLLLHTEVMPSLVVIADQGDSLEVC